MIEITDKATCSGCTACEAICSRNAITMKADALGFLYPIVDSKKCVDCGLCSRLCAFKAPQQRHRQYPITYLLRHKNDTEVLKSKSGAAFVVLSDVILKQHGVVYGARMNSRHLVEHAAATNAEERDEFRGSKYIQSDLRGIFPKVRENLKAGQKVLFSGTPCQVAGLKAFIGERLSENLFTVDILCHGVASPAIWADYIATIEHRKRKKIRRCIPRNPRYGWDNNVDSFIFQDGSQYNSEYFTGYIYHKWISQRWSCDNCPFTNLNRIGDITIGDGWGANRAAPGFDKDNRGCSLVLINTAKGEQLFESASSNSVYIPVDLTQMMQPVLEHPTTLHPKRQAFENAYALHGYKYARILYLNNTWPALKLYVMRGLRKVKRMIVR